MYAFNYFYNFQVIDILSVDLQRKIFKYTRKNIAKVSLYIKEPYVSKYVTEEKISEITMAGTIGGILGLFMGSSFLSVVEIFDFIFFKLIANKFLKT